MHQQNIVAFCSSLPQTTSTSSAKTMPYLASLPLLGGQSTVFLANLNLTMYGYRMGQFMMLSGRLTAASSLWWQASCQPRLCCLMPSASLSLTWVPDPTTSSSGTARQAHCMHTSWCSAISHTACPASSCNLSCILFWLRQAAKISSKHGLLLNRDASWLCVDLATCLETSLSWTRRQTANAKSSAKSGAVPPMLNLWLFDSIN